jgi:hypothetical protein
MHEQRKEHRQRRSPKSQKPRGPSTRPWHESALFWGTAPTGLALVVAVVGAVAKEKDLRWLLAVAFPLFCVAAWVVFTGVRSRTLRRLGVVATWLALGAMSYGLYAYLELPAVTVSPNRISVTSTDWTGLVDVTVTNHHEEPWYNPDLLIEPSDPAVEYSVEPVGGPGSEVLPFALSYTDGSQQWPISRLAPKGSVIFRLKSRLKTRSSPAEIRFSTSPGSREPPGPRVMFHQ